MRLGVLILRRRVGILVSDPRWRCSRGSVVLFLRVVTRRRECGRVRYVPSEPSSSVLRYRSGGWVVPSPRLLLMRLVTGCVDGLLRLEDGVVTGDWRVVELVRQALGAYPSEPEAEYDGDEGHCNAYADSSCGAKDRAMVNS